MIILSKCEFFSGWLSGIAGLVTGHPLETVKVRMQTFEEKSFVGVFRNTYHNEGFRGFYKGLAFPVLASGVRNAVFFGIYGNSLRALTGGGDKTLCCEDNEIPYTYLFTNDIWHAKAAFSGLLGGLASTTVTCPVECLKVKMQGNKSKARVGSWKLAKEIVKRRGVLGLYCGFTPLVFRDGPVCEFVSGWLSGIAGITTGHPLDTVKVRMQTFEDKSLGSILRSTFHNEGIRGFYKGMTFPVLSAGVLNAIFFGVYGNSLRYFTDSGDKTLCCEEGSIPIPHEAIMTPFWHCKVALSGFVGGLASTLIGCPVDCVKIKLQGNRTKKLSTWKVTKGIVNQSGVRGLYYGCIPMACRDAPGFALYILAYEHILCSMEGKLSVGAHHKFSSEIFSGGMAGAISWALAMPFDVVKTRIQMDDQRQPKYKGMRDCFRKSYQSEGLPIFFKGLGVAVVRSFPVNAVTFVVYQYSMRECKLWSSF